MSFTTVETLMNLLSELPKDMKVLHTSGGEFVHMKGLDKDTILIGNKPIAYCARTGGYVYPTTTPEYFGVSVELDEDVDEWETVPLEKEWPHLEETAE